ncbi:MAG TPA: hypothetical protein VEP49_03420 [Acidimicrobiia bacterium]|nr:hypothetical protein [Acidimicrobiia bacterium]
MTAPVHPAPRFNHIAMSVPADLLDENGRAELTRFYNDVFGFTEHEMMTEDRRRLVLGAGRVDQFLFIVSNDDPMTCPRMDHWGMSVSSIDQLDDYLDRAKKFQAEDDRVSIVDKHVDEYSFLKLWSFYVSYLLPMTVEVQFYEYTDPTRADPD